jgi:hypothetical protein
MNKVKIVVVSYVPLLVDEDPLLVDEGRHDGTEELKRKLKVVKDLYEPPIACLWERTCAYSEGKEENHISPIFVMKNAELVVNHLTMWSENEPVEWFELCVLEQQDYYGVVVWPNLQKSKERLIVAHLHKHGEIIPKNATWNFVSIPLLFHSEGIGTIKEAKRYLANMEKTKIGFIDQDDFSSDSASDIKEAMKKVHWCGPLKIRTAHEEAERFLVQYHDSAPDKEEVMDKLDTTKCGDAKPTKDVLCTDCKYWNPDPHPFKSELHCERALKLRYGRCGSFRRRR